MKWLILIFFSIKANALDLRAGTGGFLGRAQVGIGHNGFKFVYGKGELDQISIGYDYGFMKYLSVGAFVTKCQCGNAFVQSPNRYQDKNYYSITEYRAGLSFGARYKYFYINSNVLDQGLILMFNESKYKDNLGFLNSKLWGTGFGLVYDF